MDSRDTITLQKEKISKHITPEELAQGEILFYNGECQILSQSSACFELLVYDASLPEPAEFSILFEEDGHIVLETKSGIKEWNRYSYACLLEVEKELQQLDPKTHDEHKKYTREGMIKRVLAERMQKALKAEYRIKWADNIYGDHILTNERGINYRIFLRDFENQTGYSDSADAQINKLGTTKHIMYAFAKLNENVRLKASMGKEFPFVEIYCNPLNEYKISWYYPHQLATSEKLLLTKYFGQNQYIEEEQLLDFLGFFDEAEDLSTIKIRPEVRQKVESAYEQKLLSDIAAKSTVDFSEVTAELYPYQKEGVEFCLYKKNAIIADEMGLGKTLQAISIAILKKKLFGFRHALVVCPASLKEQWKKEIEKFSKEKAVVVQGFPDEREKIYHDAEEFFLIVNYETVLRDHLAMNKAGIDFLILDEAQRVKNFETKTANAVNRIKTQHILVITGTPIENKLIDIFSIVSILDPWFLGPLWEFSYQHCLFDPEKPNKINGYYDLKKLNKKLNKILLRREKRNVLDQLPNVQQINVPVELSPMQADYHASYANGIARIISKKFLTPYDLQMLQLLLTNMRMVCDSTYLIDEETNESPKLVELENILLEQLDLKNSKRKVIIFSEWVKVHKLIGRLLRDNNIGFAELNGKVPVKARGELIRKFETNEDCNVFLSTEAGGAGLNLQVADTLINFELPWNPAKKNQRIGRIDRLGQKSNKLTIFNFITRNSIEQQIAAGLLVKQNLFDGVLGTNANTNFVDFSTKGRSQFIQQLEEFISNEETAPVYFDEEEEQKSAEVADNQSREKQYELDLSGDSGEAAEPTAQAPGKEPGTIPHTLKAEDIEQVMNNGLQFLAGLYKMSTGKDMGIENSHIEVNKETGEVTMKFKLF